jgi:hypothetical protein
LKGDGLKLCNSAKKFWRLGAENRRSSISFISIFTEDVGAGAIFEMSRILTAFTMIFGRISHLILPLLLVIYKF